MCPFLPAAYRYSLQEDNYTLTMYLCFSIYAGIYVYLRQYLHNKLKKRLACVPDHDPCHDCQPCMFCPIAMSLCFCQSSVCPSFHPCIWTCSDHMSAAARVCTSMLSFPCRFAALRGMAALPKRWAGVLDGLASAGRRRKGSLLSLRPGHSSKRVSSRVLREVVLTQISAIAYLARFRMGRLYETFWNSQSGACKPP